MKSFVVLSVAAIFSSGLASAAVAPQVANRAPKPDEVGYRPADGSTVLLNPPSFIWLHETEAQTYLVQWATKNDFSEAASAGGFVWNTYTHDAPLVSGTWFWRYAFVNTSGATSTWSTVRSVIVPASATAFPMPSRAQQRERVPSGHPRLFLRPEDLPRLRELAKGGE